MKEKLFEEYSFEVFSMARQTLSAGEEDYYLDRGDVELLDTKSIAMNQDGTCVFEIETLMEDDLINELAELFEQCGHDTDKFETAIEEKYEDKLI